MIFFHIVAYIVPHAFASGWGGLMVYVFTVAGFATILAVAIVAVIVYCIISLIIKQSAVKTAARIRSAAYNIVLPFSSIILIIWSLFITMGAIFELS